MDAPPSPHLEPGACHRALSARDARFDGLFFVGVTTTGIYCRPVCPARTPAPSRCVFFRRGAEAEKMGFRACFRCRPELAPGSARTEALSRLVARAVARIEAGALDDVGLEALAQELGVSSRHLRRATDRELGVSPVELAQSTRLALAKQLLSDTSLPVASVAFASGFKSVRRFNALVRERLGRPPSALRRPSAALSQALSLTLGFREPFAFSKALAFLAARATAGVEVVGADEYARTVVVGSHRGWLRVKRAQRPALRVELDASLAPALLPIAARVRALFDLDADPAVVDESLARDAFLARLVRTTPGLRVPGAFDGFELAVRAILGQQVSVRGATTLAGRLAARFGEALESPVPGLDRFFPAAGHLAAASVADIAGIGLPRARAETIRTLAANVASGTIELLPHADADETIARLERLPGIGPWSAQYIAMRALGRADAFPGTDLGLRRALETSSKELAVRAEAWRPFRAYAALHLWSSKAGG